LIDSRSPPGHWYISRHPCLQQRNIRACLTAEQASPI